MPCDVYVYEIVQSMRFHIQQLAAHARIHFAGAILILPFFLANKDVGVVRGLEELYVNIHFISTCVLLCLSLSLRL